MTPHIATFVREKIARHPEPPRHVTLHEVLRLVMKTKSMKVVLVVTLPLAFTLLGLGVSGGAGDRVVILILGFLILIIACAPLFYAQRLTKAIRSGRTAFAVVESVQYSGPGSRDTLDAIENGIARGSWRVPETGSVDFEVDEPWAKDLSVGSRVELLVAGTTSSGIFPLNVRS